MRKNVSQNETPQDLLKNYKSRLAKEGWLKAALCGMSVGSVPIFSAQLLSGFSASSCSGSAFLSLRR